MFLITSHVDCEADFYSSSKFPTYKKICSYAKATIDNMQMNEQCCVPTQVYEH